MERSGWILVLVVELFLEALHTALFSYTHALPENPLRTNPPLLPFYRPKSRIRENKVKYRGQSLDGEGWCVDRRDACALLTHLQQIVYSNCHSPHQCSRPVRPTGMISFNLRHGVKWDLL